MKFELLKEAFKSTALRQIIEAAKNSHAAEKAKQAGDAERNKDKTGYRKDRTTKITQAFKDVNNTLYKTLGLKLNEITDDVFEELDPITATRKVYNEDNLWKFFIGGPADKPELIGMTQGVNVLYTSGSSKLTTEVPPKSDTSARVDTLDKGQSWRQNRYNPSGRGRDWEWKEEHGSKPSQKAIAEMSTKVFVLDIKKVNNPDLHLGTGVITKDRAERKAGLSTDGSYIRDKKTGKENYKHGSLKLRNGDVRDKNLERYSQLKKKSFLPSDIEARYNKIQEQITELRKRFMSEKSRENLDKLSKIEIYVAEQIKTYYENLSSVLSYTKDTGYGADKYETDYPYKGEKERDKKVTWKKGYDSKYAERYLERAVEALKLIEEKLAGYISK